MKMLSLSDKERIVIQEVLKGELTKQQIADKVGYKNRSSVYKVLEKEEAQEYMQTLADRAVGEAVSILKANANEAARNLVKIASGNIDDTNKQTVYALLQAINSVLEKSGLSSKNITLKDDREKENKVSNEDILSAIDDLEEESK
ncbi:MAG TPA: hypothetical protein GXX63_02210 [Tissierellia bacterium]|nr:hypothetical protein [Tissierellia bacterium]